MPNWSDTTYKCVGDPKEVRSLYKVIQRNAKRKRPRVKNGFGTLWLGCIIGACASIRADYHQGNIYDDDFMDVWENRYAPYRNRNWMKHDDCATCRYWRYCRGGGMHLRDANGNLLFCHLNRMLAKKDSKVRK